MNSLIPFGLCQFPCESRFHITLLYFQTAIWWAGFKGKLAWEVDPLHFAPSKTGIIMRAVTIAIDSAHVVAWIVWSPARNFQHVEAIAELDLLAHRAVERSTHRTRVGPTRSRLPSYFRSGSANTYNPAPFAG